MILCAARPVREKMYFASRCAEPEVPLAFIAPKMISSFVTRAQSILHIPAAFAPSSGPNTGSKKTT